MHSFFIQYVFLILIILALVMIADRLRLAYPIVLVVGGLALSFTHQFSHIAIDPELFFFIFLPPLLYEAAWQISWKEFWRWRRLIASFAFLIVIITACVIAFAAHALIPGFTLALGFLLGGIISPPDAISATTIMRRLNLPKAMVSITEGESLLNDASSLIVFRFALAAVLTGQFYLQEAAVTFVLVIVGGIGVGLALGFCLLSDPSTAAYHHQHRDRSDSHHAVLSLLLCGDVSFFGCAGCRDWRLVSLLQAAEALEFQESHSGCERLDQLRLRA
jgi:CPA1 family monovalent cation:H+ antiporter